MKRFKKRLSNIKYSFHGLASISYNANSAFLFNHPKPETRDLRKGWNNILRGGLDIISVHNVKFNLHRLNRYVYKGKRSL